MAVLVPVAVLSFNWLSVGAVAVSVYCGTGTRGFNDGSCSSAWFNRPLGIALDNSTLYIADSGSYLLRAIDMASGACDTIACYRTCTPGSSNRCNSAGWLRHVGIDACHRCANGCFPLFRSMQAL